MDLGKLGHDLNAVDPINFGEDFLEELGVVGVVVLVEPEVFEEAEQRVEEGDRDSDIRDTCDRRDRRGGSCYGIASLNALAFYFVLRGFASLRS